MNKKFRFILYMFLYSAILFLFQNCSSEAKRENISVKEEMRSEQETRPAVAPPAPKPSGVAVQDTKRKDKKEESDGKIPDKQKTDSFNSFKENPFISAAKEKFSNIFH